MPASVDSRMGLTLLFILAIFAGLVGPGRYVIADDPQPKAADVQEPDSGSDLLRNIQKTSAPLLADMAENHGYGLAENRSVGYVAPPFPDVRMTYYKAGHPSQADSIPRGPDELYRSSISWAANSPRLRS